jgi:UDP-glucose 4-epimerase
MKVLITGGAGFIGSHLANSLIKADYEVIILDNLSTGSFENIPKQATFLEMDLSDLNCYSEIPTDIDIVYHLASQASGEVSFDDPVHDLKSNTLATLALLQWSKANSIKKFIFSSTMGVYSDALKTSATEKSEILPKSFYGVNKLTSENYIRIFREEGLDATIFRFFNVYGPGQNMANMKQGMVSIYMAYLKNNEPIIVKGPLNRSRDFVYIDDIVNALVLGLKKTDDNEYVFNVCSGRRTSVNELLQLLIKVFNKKEDYPVHIVNRTARDIDHCWGSNELIINKLYWKPKISLEDGILLMYKWLKSND